MGLVINTIRQQIKLDDRNNQESGPGVDNIAVTGFTDLMRSKMRASRAKGRYGWWDRGICTIDDLKTMLANHIEKGDMVDVANIAMMIHYREQLDREGS